MDHRDEARLITRLRDAVEQTKAAYERAKQDFERAKDLEAESSDGGFARGQALRRERRAFQDFRQAVFEFNRLILDGKLPGED